MVDMASLEIGVGLIVAAYIGFSCLFGWNATFATTVVLAAIFVPGGAIIAGVALIVRAFS